MLTGAFQSTKKDGSIYYRSSITHNGKHISLGSFPLEEEAHQAYLEALAIYENQEITLLNLGNHIHLLSHDKAISLLNHRDHKIYIKTPIYLQSGFFSYYLKDGTELKFDNDDLFYYSSHKILNRKGHLYVNDYGMQYSILDRFGVKSYSVAGRDYSFANGDATDLRYSNIIVINHYHGVCRIETTPKERYEAKIHLNGDYLIGRYNSEVKAAVAYNKAIDYARDHGIQKDFIENYINELSAKEYADLYMTIALPEKYMNYIDEYTHA